MFLQEAMANVLSSRIAAPLGHHDDVDESHLQLTMNSQASDEDSWSPGALLVGLQSLETKHFFHGYGESDFDESFQCGTSKSERSRQLSLTSTKKGEALISLGQSDYLKLEFERSMKAELFRSNFGLAGGLFPFFRYSISYRSLWLTYLTAFIYDCCFSVCFFIKICSV
jgi:hypothetical protein